MGLMMLRPLLMARIFDPQTFATYGAGLLVSSTFCMLGALGLQPLLQRKMPMDLVLGKEVSSLVLMTQGVMVAAFCAIIVGVLGFSKVSIAALDSESFVVSLCHGLSQQLFVLVTIESRSRGQPLRFAWQNLMRASFVVIGASVVALSTGSPEITLSTEASLSLLVSMKIGASVFSRSPLQLGSLVRLAARRVPRIRWLDALALMGVMLVGFALTSADRWIAAGWLSAHQFAIYAFAWIILTAAQSIQSIINSSVYPSLARRFANQGCGSSFRLASTASLTLLLAGSVLLWPFYYFCKFLISIFFVQYHESVYLLPIFLGVAVVRLSDFWSSHLIIIGRERLLLLINVCSGLITLVGWFGVRQLEVAPIGGQTLAWLALSLTLVNYLFVTFAATWFRR